MSEAGLFDDRRRYAEYLDATWRVRQPLEQALDQCNAAHLFGLWPHRRIAPALEADIADLSGEPPQETNQQCASFLNTPAQTLGVLYVLEGSALGARLLAPRAAAIGMSPSFGARHMAAQTALPNAWSNFLAVLESAHLNCTQEDECVDAALKTFDLFDNAIK